MSVIDHHAWRRRLVLALALCTMTPFAAAETLTLCVENADVRPWRTHDGKGLNFQLLDRAAKAAGVEFRYSMMAWPRCLALLRAGEVDGGFAASFKPERLEIGAFPGGTRPDERKRLHADRYMVVRSKGAPVEWDGKTFRRLDGPIGTQLGYSINDSLKKLGVSTDDGTQTAEALLRKLRAGRVPAAAMLEGELRSVLAANRDLAAAVEILPTPIEEKPYFLMLSHARMKKDPKQAERIWAAIETIRQSRDYQRLERDALAGGER